MPEKVTPMIHVPDVSATVNWYRDIGFTVLATYGRDGEGLSFAILRYGNTEVMFNQGGQSSSARRREVDLYVYVDNVDDIYATLKDRVELIEGLHNTFYGMREFIIRDLNRFWITFGQPSPFGELMNGISENRPEMIQSALESGGLSQEELTNALVEVAALGKDAAEIRDLLEKAGAQMPRIISTRVLESHAGKYRSAKGMEVEITVKDGKLFAEPFGESPISLIAIDEITFRPLQFQGVTVTFSVDEDKTTGFELREGSQTTRLNRV